LSESGQHAEAAELYGRIAQAFQHNPRFAELEQKAMERQASELAQAGESVEKS
jgi:hypothetical protein